MISADTIGRAMASKIRGQGPRGCALGRNYVETTMNVNARDAVHAAAAIGSA
jgi:hypothetical protein